MRSSKFMNPKSELGKVLEDYYWNHRNYRLSRFHHHSGLEYKVLEDIVQNGRKPTKEELMKAVEGLLKIRNSLNDKITGYCKELSDVISREYGESKGSTEQVHHVA